MLQMDDKKNLRLIREAEKAYENGEIVEAGEMLKEVVKSIDAFDIAMELIDSVPSAETHDKRTETHGVCSDLISRQAAIDALAKFVPYAICDESTESYTNGLTDAYNLILQLPSAQPEVIRCTECKHYREYDSEYVENAVVVQCMADRYPISKTIPDGWFCAGAERKEI